MNFRSKLSDWVGNSPAFRTSIKQLVQVKSLLQAYGAIFWKISVNIIECNRLTWHAFCKIIVPNRENYCHLNYFNTKKACRYLREWCREQSWNCWIYDFRLPPLTTHQRVLKGLRGLQSQIPRSREPTRHLFSGLLCQFADLAFYWASLRPSNLGVSIRNGPVLEFLVSISIKTSKSILLSST